MATIPLRTVAVAAGVVAPLFEVARGAPHLFAPKAAVRQRPMRWQARACSGMSAWCWRYDARWAARIVCREGLLMIHLQPLEEVRATAFGILWHPVEVAHG